MLRPLTRFIQRYVPPSVLWLVHSCFSRKHVTTRQLKTLQQDTVHKTAAPEFITALRSFTSPGNASILCHVLVPPPRTSDLRDADILYDVFSFQIFCSSSLDAAKIFHILMKHIRTFIIPLLFSTFLRLESLLTSSAASVLPFLSPRQCSVLFFNHSRIFMLDFEFAEWLLCVVKC